MVDARNAFGFRLLCDAGSTMIDYFKCIAAEIILIEVIFVALAWMKVGMLLLW